MVHRLKLKGQTRYSQEWEWKVIRSSYIDIKQVRTDTVRIKDKHGMMMLLNLLKAQGVCIHMEPKSSFVNN